MSRSPSDIHDELLVLRCRRGDTAAWDELARRYNDRLWYYVRRFVNDEHRAVQVVQDIWVHVLRGLKELRQADRLAPWLYTIARRTILSEFRRQYADTQRTEEAQLEQVVDDQPMAADQFDNAELVNYGLGQIGWTEREVLTLYFLDDLSIAEIGRVLDIPSGTVKSRLSRARNELRQVLERQAAASRPEEQR